MPLDAVAGRSGVIGGGGGGCAKVKLGLMLPESWLPGMSETATEEFGCKLLTPLLSLDTPGRGAVKLLELEGPGSSVIRLMSEEDMLHLAAACDNSAPAQLQKELAVDNSPRRLEEEAARMEEEGEGASLASETESEEREGEGEEEDEGADEEEGEGEGAEPQSKRLRPALD